MDKKRVYGIHAIEGSLKTETPIRLFLREGKESGRLHKLLQLAQSVDCPIERVSAERLARLCDGDKSHQGVVLDVISESIIKADLNQILQAMKGDKGKMLFLLLDGVTDPGNLGACLRSAATMGVAAVIAPKNASAPLNADAIKRSSGGASQVPYIQVVNLARCMEQLKSEGVWIVGTVLEAKQSIETVDLRGDIAIVMGSEGKGMRRLTREACDELISID